MKKLLYYLCGLFLTPTAVLAQQPMQVSSAGNIEHKVAMRAYAGKPYRVSVRARVDSLQDGEAKIDVAAFVLNKERNLLDIHSLAGPPARNPQWQTYSFTNKLGATTDTVLIRLFYFMNGTFAFDDLAVEVQQDGKWLSVPILNGDFQTPPPAVGTLPLGWGMEVPIAGFTTQWRNTSGNAYLEVRSRSIVAYGNHAPAGHYCRANGVKLYYETYGQGPPLLLLHGNGQSIQDLSNQIAALAPTYRVIAVDTRDHGKSAATKGPLTYDLFADDMRALLDSLGLNAVHVVGWSDGANTGLSLALRYPARVKSLVTMGANLYADTTAVKASMLQTVRHDRLMASVLTPFGRSYRLARRLTTMLLRHPNLKPSDLAAIQLPVLVLAGERDVITRSHTLLIGRSISGAQVRIFSGLTHDAPKENPLVFNETVLNFLNRIEKQ